MLAFHHIVAIAVAATSLARAHTVITYPGWRGNNLHTNGTLPEDNPDTVGVDFYEDGTMGFPYGMQWIYPCMYTHASRRSIASSFVDKQG